MNQDKTEPEQTKTSKEESRQGQTSIPIKPSENSSQTLFQSNEDIQKSAQPPRRSRLEHANFFSRLHFLYIIPLICLANKKRCRELSVDDLDNIPSNMHCEYLGNLFTSYYPRWKAQNPKKRLRLTLALILLFKKDLCKQLFWQLLYGFTRVLMAFFLERMLRSISKPDDPLKNAYLPALGIFICNLLSFYASHHSGWNTTKTANKLKAGILGMLMKKMSKLSLYSIQNLHLGKVINIIGIDLNNLENASIVSLIVAPFVFFGAFGFLYDLWGPSCCVGFGYLMLVWIIQRIVIHFSVPLRHKKGRTIDDRIEPLEEAIEGIRPIKMYAWEFHIINYIKKLRRIEVKHIKRIFFTESFPKALLTTCQWISSFLILLTYSQIEGDIPNWQIFPTVLVLTFVTQISIIQIFHTHTFRQEMIGLSNRVASIMDLLEVEQEQTVSLPLNKENSIEFHNFTASWKAKYADTASQAKNSAGNQTDEVQLEQIYPVISNINLGIKKGSYVAIVGKVASGKSSLLAAFTGEMNRIEGELRYEGTYAYVGEESFVGEGIIKDIIISGKPFEESLFWEVVDACCLRRDIEDFPDAEMTNIGESAVNLNQEQKEKLMLARALYLKADIYLLDDPLGWVDARTAKEILKKAILGFLKDKTVLLITYRLNFVKYADYVIVLKAGKIAKQGTYEELARKNEAIIPKYKSKQERIEEDSPKLKKKLRKYKLKRHESGLKSQNKIQINEKMGARVLRQDEGLFLEDERLDDAHVRFSTYYNYFRAMLKWFIFPPLFFLFAAGGVCEWLLLIFLGKWGGKEWDNEKAIIVIGCVAGTATIIHFFKYLLYFNLTLNASEKLHNKMLVSIFFSHLKFFDKNPIGRILSRFSNDIGILDKYLINALLELLEGFAMCTAFLIAIWVKEPWIFLCAGVVTFFGIIITIWCRKAINQTRMLELSIRAPIYSSFTFLMENLSNIRSRNQTDQTISQLNQRVDNYSRVNIAHLVSARFMRFLIDYVTELTVIVTICIFIPQKNTPLASGFFIVMLILLPSLLQWILKSLFTFNLFMASAARIITYCKNIKRVDLNKPDDIRYRQNGWPQSGEIKIRNATVRYGEKSDPFINDLSLSIASGEKIAIIERSRAGMSGIVAMLTKIFEVDQSPSSAQIEESYVKIDGVDIKDVGLHLLRRSMVIMPQEAFIFTGTIRQNLDPWRQHLDFELWRALEQAGLKEFVENLNQRMETKLHKYVPLLSLGQRQLLCLARSFLDRKNIIIQDEATSHLDIPSNMIIQDQILKQYEKSTIVTITHRLMAIIKYEKVLIMKDGKILEFDEPYKLLVEDIKDQEITKDSYFANLILNLGSKLSMQAFLISKKRYYLKHKLNFGNDNSGAGNGSGNGNLQHLAYKKDKINPHHFPSRLSLRNIRSQAETETFDEAVSIDNMLESSK